MEKLPRWCVVLAVLVGLVRGSDVVRETAYGKVRGNLRDVTTATGVKQVEVFLGVPYARSPAGTRRFSRPEKPIRWAGVRNALSAGPPCPQPTAPAIAGYRQVGTTPDEDCLFLNIYAPKHSKKPKKYPVLVFVHGGDFMFGTGSAYDGSLLAATQNIVVVTINYRLGVLGFLTMGDNDLQGNYGIMDQIEALKWVRKNIANFSGVRSEVTVFGHQSGASCVSVLMVSPLAKDLFKRTILSSGSPLQPVSVRPADQVVRQTRALAKHFNCDGFTSTLQMLDCLNKIRYEALVAQETIVHLEVAELPKWTPVVDRKVLPVPMDQQLRRMQVNGEACMLGFTGTEWASKAAIELALDGGMSAAEFRMLIENIINQIYPDAPEEVADLVTYEYTSWLRPGDRFATRNSYIQAISDALYVAPAIQSAAGTTLAGLSTYVYQFSGSDGRSLPGALDDVSLIFPEQPARGAAAELSAAIMDLVGSFGRTGTPQWETENLHIFSQEAQDFLKIDNINDTREENFPRRKQVTFWNKIVPSLITAAERAQKNAGPTSASDRAVPTVQAPDISWTTKGVIIGIMVIGIFLPVMTLFFVLYVMDFRKQWRKRKLSNKMTDENRYAPPPTVAANDRPPYPRFQITEDQD
ncbi:cholinesterase 1-like [Branchiostoma floridae]|uniref:Cholinesterase 1-like n=1 Tax=Branchiostoma floridae TaxID=7739 RepID=A0A9J7LEQ4_BRAFL|nr:cholinesterase 1-like [Branchiostoma floridae]